MRSKQKQKVWAGKLGCVRDACIWTGCAVLMLLAREMSEPSVLQLSHAMCYLCVPYSSCCISLIFCTFLYSFEYLLSLLSASCVWFCSSVSGVASMCVCACTHVWLAAAPQDQCRIHGGPLHTHAPDSMARCYDAGETQHQMWNQHQRNQPVLLGAWQACWPFISFFVYPSTCPSVCVDLFFCPLARLLILASSYMIKANSARMDLIYKAITGIEELGYRGN